jgi:GR25 family glycosyltransferase involved in LPS biosynthesis
MLKILNLLIRFNCISILMILFSTVAEGKAKPYQNLFKPIDAEPRSSIEGIDNVYVINLDVRPEKWHRVESILYYHGIDNNRFSAVFGWDFDIPTIKKYCAKHLRVGQLGCMLSHLSIYQDALDRGLKVIWVLEDDVEVMRNPKVLTKLIQELNEIDPEWDVLYTDLDFIKEDGTFVRSLAFPIDKAHPFPHPLSYYTRRINVSQNIQMIRSRFGTASMIVSERGMKKALHYFTTNDDILWPYDIEFHYIPDIKQYGVINPVVTNGHFSYNFSDTGTCRLKKFYEIDDEHVQYLEERSDLFEGILRNWLGFLGLKKTNI